MQRAIGLGVWMVAWVVLATGCDDGDWYSSLWGDEVTDSGDSSRPRRRRSKTDFVSADPYGNTSRPTSGTPPIDTDDASSTPQAGSPTAAPAAGQNSAGTRAVERGDLFRVLPDGRILNLNAYRGVQILDVRDVNAPRLEGRVALTGSPVEMYVVGNRALVLVNNWQAYYGARTDIPAHDPDGGLVLSVDLTDRAHPVITSRAAVGGQIITSRLTQGGGQAALYVAAMDYTQGEAVVKSFDVTAAITARSSLSLGGYVQDIQATNALLMVASNNWEVDQGRSRIALVDISSPDGTMVQGGSVVASGYVRSKFNLDARGGVLRVVSESSQLWFGTPRPAASTPTAAATSSDDVRHRLETWSIADLQNPQAIDSCAFGEVNAETGRPDSLFASIFLDDRAFFVTYLRRDPFHAFSVDAAGECEEHNEFIVSGWNDFFRATFDDTRLIGVGHNDVDNSRKLSVSLYDAVNLTNPTPLLARSDIDLEWASSVANWDDLGFSVLENAVSVASADGTAETALLLLPYEGYDESTQNYLAGVQLFTFSDHTLTRRGTMDHGSSVRRTFAVEPGTTANVSEDLLSLFDTQNPDAPAARGKLELAPNYARLFVFGDYVARLKAQLYTSPTGGGSDRIEILPRGADLDGAGAVATIEAPAGSQWIQVGALLVSATSEIQGEPQVSEEAPPPTYLTTLRTYDLSDPTAPRARGVLETDRFAPNYYYPYGITRGDCFGPRCGFGVGQNYVVGDAIAFVHVVTQRESLGHVHVCDTYVEWTCEASPNGGESCEPPPIQGGITCVTREGAEEECYGEFYECTPEGLCEVTTEVPEDLVETCYDYEEFRYWASYAFDSLDLRDPDQLSLAPRLELPTDEEAYSLYAAGTSIYYNFQKPYDVPRDERSYVKKYVRIVDFDDPAAPTAGPAINVPGDVVAVDGDSVYTRDWVWSSDIAQSCVARVTLADDYATLEARRVYADRSIGSVLLDGAGHVLLTSDAVYTELVEPTSQPSEPIQQPWTKLNVLDGESLATEGEADVDSWAGLRAVAGGRALFDVSSGFLVFDVSDPSAPSAQAYLSTIGWANDLYFDGSEVLLASGPYGVFRLDATQTNLTPQ